MAMWHQLFACSQDGNRPHPVTDGEDHALGLVQGFGSKILFQNFTLPRASLIILHYEPWSGAGV